MKKAIKIKGLGRFIAPDSEDRIRKGKLILDGTGHALDFDPLIVSGQEISDKFLAVTGLAGWHAQCPLCAVKEHYYGLDDNWINGSTDNALSEAMYRRLVPPWQ